MAVAHKGSISMGLVLIPVGLYKTTVDNDIHFNQLDKESKARIRYKNTAVIAIRKSVRMTSSRGTNMRRINTW